MSVFKKANFDKSAILKEIDRIFSLVSNESYKKGLNQVKYILSRYDDLNTIKSLLEEGYNYHKKKGGVHFDAIAHAYKDVNSVL
jgi:hypothetical protein